MTKEKIELLAKVSELLYILTFFIYFTVIDFCNLYSANHSIIYCQSAINLENEHHGRP